MSVYVDRVKIPYRGMVMCHMVADTIEELHSMADLIGVNRKWFQSPDKARHPHYDICQAKKALALKFGAVETSDRRLFISKAKKLREELLLNSP